MPGQQQPSSTEQALAPLHEAEQKILSALSASSLAFRALSSEAGPSAAPSAFSTHAATFLKDLLAAQELIRSRIAHITADVPFENVTMRRLIEADLGVQRTAHVHRALVRTLAALDEAPPPGTLSAAASPSWMPSPVASTPLAALGVAAASPPTAAAPITIAVPSPDAAAADVQLSAAVALNGGVAPPLPDADPAQASDHAQTADTALQGETDAPDRMEL